MPWMYLTTSGNLGIGISSPTYLLELGTGDLNLTDGMIRIGDDEMVVSDGNNVAIGTYSDLQSITTGINNMLVGVDAGIAITSASNNSFFGENAGERITTGGENVFVGFNAGTNMQAGKQNVFVGARAGVLSTGDDNVMVGNNTGTDNTTGEDNVFVGSQAGANNTVGDDNVFIGYEAGMTNTTGFQNLFIGSQAGEDNTTGDSNTFIGFNTGQNNTIGTDNMFLGMQAGFNNISGACNVYIGREAAFHSTGSRNMAIGEAAGWRSTGNDNVYMGFRAGITENVTATNGSGNTIMGRSAGDHSTNTYIADNVTLIGSWANTPNSPTDIDNATAIGHRAYVTASNALVLGSIANTNGAASDEDTNVGIGVTAPANRLEIKRGTPGNGISGLRLTSLAGSTPSAPTGEVLTIDANGDVILVRDSIGSGGVPNDDWHITGNTGTTAGAPSNNFIGTTDEIDFVIATDNQEWMRVIGGTTNQGNVGIHTTTPTAVLHVVDDASASSNTAIYGYVTNGTVSKAVEGYSYLTGGTAGYGGYFFADAGVTGPATNYGVYAEAAGASTNYAGYFTGNGVYTGTWTQSSDRKLKQNIENLVGLNLILQLSPKSYQYRIEEYPALGLHSGTNYGLIAQELEAVIPELVSNIEHPAKLSDKGEVVAEGLSYKGVNYIGLIPFTISAIQEQQTMLEDKEQRIVSLEKEVQRLALVEQAVSEMKQQLAVLLEQGSSSTEMEVTVGFADNIHAEKTELHQNRPNPFRDLTTFSYSLGSSGKVELNIYSMEGVFIETITSAYQEKGEHKVEWDSKDIPNGMYFYILTVDGMEWVKKAIRLQ